VAHALNLFNASEGRLSEFLRRVHDADIKENNIKLPVLPGGKKYQYDVEKHELVVIDASTDTPAEEKKDGDAAANHDLETRYGERRASEAVSLAGCVAFKVQFNLVQAGPQRHAWPLCSSETNFGSTILASTTSQPSPGGIPSGSWVVKR